MDGTYTFTSGSNIDTMGYFYNSPFDPSNPTANLITDDDDGGEGQRFKIEVYLQAGQTYVLVVTTHEEFMTGSFSVSTFGPASVSIMSITPSTSQPILLCKWIINLIYFLANTILFDMNCLFIF